MTEHHQDVEESTPQKINPQHLWQLLRHIVAYRGVLILGLLLLSLSSGAALLEPRLFGYIVDLGIVPKNWAMLRLLGLLYLGLVLGRVFGIMGQLYFFEKLGQLVAQELRCRLFSHLLRLPVSVYDKNPVGRLMTRVTNDISAISEMFSAGFVSMVGNLVLLCGILSWLLYLNFKLGLLSLAVFPVLLVASVYFSRRLKVAYREARSRLSALNTFLAENLLGMRIVHLFNREAHHMERFRKINQWYCEAQQGSVKVFALFQPSITLASGVAVSAVILFGGERVLNQEIPIGVLVAYFSYVLALFQPLREMADKWNIFLSGMASAERVFSILAWPVELGEQDVKTSYVEVTDRKVRGEIVFENVWFAYAGESGKELWILRDFSLRIAPGARIGVVGHTGAGKTTLIGLLTRFYEPQRGRILIDGRDIREFELRELRSLFGLIQQDGFLFTGTVEENITFWQQSLEYRQVLQEAGLSLEALGLHSAELRERANNISTGQRQVLAFARALVSRPKIWILDEATANVDVRTELVLQSALEKVSQGCTTILIAHRLSTIRACDNILVLNKGVPVEQGTHEELVQLNGLYARLDRYQAARESRQPL